MLSSAIIFLLTYTAICDTHDSKLAWRAEEPDEDILKNHEGWSQNGQVFGTEEFRILMLQHNY